MKWNASTLQKQSQLLFRISAHLLKPVYMCAIQDRIEVLPIGIRDVIPREHVGG